MPRLKFTIELNYETAEPGSDFIFCIHAAQTRFQRVIHEALSLNQALLQNHYTDPATHTRFLRVNARAGPLCLLYDATVDLNHYTAPPGQIGEVAVADLPGEVLPYISPSRYCQSDRLGRLAMNEFGHLWHGYGRVQAVCDWVTERVTFRSNSSNSNTTAVDTLVEKVGVCRDFAHLMIALCRALNIPARFATGIDFGASPTLGPTDFHAYVEVYLAHRWFIFDPSGVAIPMGFLRFGTGRDAADVAFATIFGDVRGSAPVITVAAIADGQGVLVVPHKVDWALSTDAHPASEMLQTL